MATTEITLVLSEHAWPLTWITLGSSLVLLARMVLKSHTAAYLAHVEALRWSRRRTGLPKDKLHELIVDAARQEFSLGDPP